MLYGRSFVYVNVIFLDPEAQTLWSCIMAIGQFQQYICLLGVNQNPKDSKKPPLYGPGTWVLIKVWKDGFPKAQLQPMWKGPYPVILSTSKAVKVPGHDSWIHYSQVKPWKIPEEDIQYTCEPLGELRYLFRTTNECHSNEHPLNQVYGGKISQDSFKEPTQLDRSCTPKYTRDRSPDPWKRRHLSHLEWDVLNEKYPDPTGPWRMSWRVLGLVTISLWGIILLVKGNLELANASTNPCYHILMLLMIAPCINCLVSA